MSLRILVVASETPDQQDARRARSGEASHETYASTLRAIDATLRIEDVSCVTGDAGPDGPALSGFDGIVFAGSPIQMHDVSDATRSAARFMERVFESGTPSFGSCAGLQIAAVSAGGSVRARTGRMEAGFARGIWPTEAGTGHFLLRGRPGAWDAPAMHASMVDRLPEGGTVLARTVDTPVEAARIRRGAGTFHGVQYHPEISLTEVAQALRDQAETLVEQDLAADAAAVERYAGTLETLDADPGRRDLAWQLGLDREVTDRTHRQREITNFLDHLRG